MIIAPCGAVDDEMLGMMTAVAEVSGGNDLKKLSTFFACSLSVCLIQPTMPFFALTRYHLIPPDPWVSAMGVAFSPGAIVPIVRALSSAEA